MRTPAQIHVLKLEDFSNREKMEFPYENFYRIFFVKKSFGHTELVFLNPRHRWLSELGREGCICIFSGSFFTKIITDKLDALFSEHTSRTVYSLDKKQESQLDSIFRKMLLEINSHYTYRDDLLRNYISEITHIAIKSLVTKISV